MNVKWILIVAVACITATAARDAGAGATTVVTLHPGQSKKIGVYTVVCTTKAAARTRTRIVLRPGYAVTVRGIRIRCVRVAVPTPTPVPIPVPAPPPVPQPGSRTNPFPLGIRAASSTWAITVNSTNFDAWPVIQAANMFNSAPSAGGQDVMASLTITYVGPGSTTLTDLIVHLGIVGSGGVEYRSFTNSCGVLPPPREFDYSTLFSGATIQLNLCWQVASVDVGSLEFVYNEQSWFALK